jgi:hypothetical protein
MAEIIINLIEEGRHKNKEKRSVRIESVLDWQEVAEKELKDINDMVCR